MIDGEREFRLRPGQPHVSKPRHDGIALATGFKMLMHYARQSSARRRRSSTATRRYPHRQRCAVRITYSKNTVRGQWRAHGRYLERESAAHGETGFDAHKRDVQVSRKLQDWQANKDQLLWKFIISPEFGDRADLERLTRELMLRVSEDLGGSLGSLEWVAVVHRNTEHPHVHIALRGQAADGRALRLSRDYVKCGVREIAEGLCTRQLGFRTALDAAEAERREIPQNRVTSLDRLILRNSAAVENGLAFTPTAEAGRAHNHHVAARLIALSRMGLAEQMRDGSWLLRTNVEPVLRAMQRAGDRQKTLFAHGELVSDKRLPVEAVDWQQIAAVEGRVLTHGEEEHSGKNYLLLESTAARVYYIPYTREMEESRSLGGLKTNSFIRLRRRSGNGRLRIEIEDLGHAEAVLTNRALLREKAEALRRQGVRPTEEAWGGWLGKYQKALCAAEADLEMLVRKDPVGTIRSIEHTLRNPDKLADEQKTRVIRMQREVLDYQAEAGRPFEHKERLNQSLARQAELNSALDPDTSNQQGADSAPELKDDLEVSQNPPAAEPNCDQVAIMAEAYMRASKTAIREMPISQRTPPQTGPVTGRVVAKDDEHIALATAANSFFVVHSTFLGRVVEIGERLSLRFQRGIPSLEDDRARGR
jgi:type IV secretory pathway VirD2 relaxase